MRFSMVMLIAMAGGCTRSADIRCLPGVSAGCTCTDGASGAQVCGNDGRFGACTCDGRGGVGGGAGGAGGGGGDGGDTGDPVPRQDPPTSVPGGPMVLSFKTSTAALTEGLAVNFSAIITHPAGVEALTGAMLTSPDGGHVYGSFVETQKGAYSLQLSWAQIQQVLTVDFIQKDARKFMGTFYDASGNQATATVVVTLNCSGNPCCGGKCLTDQDSPPPTCQLQYVKSSTPTSCNTLCATKNRGCSSECTEGFPDTWAALLLYGNAQVDSSKDCAAVPPPSIMVSTQTLPFTAMSCCCF